MWWTLDGSQRTSRCTRRRSCDSERLHACNAKHHNAWKRHKPSRDSTESDPGTTMLESCLDRSSESTRWARALEVKAVVSLVLPVCLDCSCTCVVDTSLPSGCRDDWSVLRVLSKPRFAYVKASRLSRLVSTSKLYERSVLELPGADMLGERPSSTYCCCGHARRATSSRTLRSVGEPEVCALDV